MKKRTALHYTAAMKNRPQNPLLLLPECLTVGCKSSEKSSAKQYLEAHQSKADSQKRGLS